MKEIKRTFEALEEQLEDIADVEATPTSITVHKGGKTWLFSQHTPTSQLWLASPISGAWHFVWQNNAWRSTRGGEVLEAVVAAELL